MGIMENKTPNTRAKKLLNIVIVSLLVVGIALIALSIAAEFLGLDLTPGFGIVQMFQLLLGISSVTFAIFLWMRQKRGDAPRSLQADIGVRLAATGLVFAYVAGFSDLLLIGTHVAPRFERPFVGPLQLGGLVLSIFLIAAGILLYYTSRGVRAKSSMEFIVNGNGDHKNAG